MSCLRGCSFSSGFRGDNDGPTPLLTPATSLTSRSAWRLGLARLGRTFPSSFSLLLSSSSSPSLSLLTPLRPSLFPVLLSLRFFLLFLPPASSSLAYVTFTHVSLLLHPKRSNPPASSWPSASDCCLFFRFPLFLSLLMFVCCAVLLLYFLLRGFLKCLPFSPSRRFLTLGLVSARTCLSLLFHVTLCFRPILPISFSFS